jgi:hypothetical protein
MLQNMTRRSIFQFAAGLAAAGPSAAAPTEPKYGEFRPVASYSFHEFQRKLTISMIKQLGVIRQREGFHLPYTISADDAAKAKSELRKPG